MEDLNINRDKPEMTDEQILKYKNFDAVLNTAATNVVKPWYNLAKFWLIGGGIAVVSVITIIVVTNLDSVTETDIKSDTLNSEGAIDKTSDLSVIDSVLTDEVLTSVIHVVDEGVVYSSEGMAIEVPSGVITSDSGIEKDEYDINFTSFSVPSEIELPIHSRIECFQIDLYADGETVELYGADAMMVKGNVTIYESFENEWKPLEIHQYEKEEIKLDSIPSMLLPEKMSKQPFSFAASYEVKDKTKGFVEISGYDNVVFQPLNSIPSEWKDPEMWEDVEIQQISKGTYTLSLHKNDVVKKCDVKVVFKDADYLNALRVYETTFITHESISTVKANFQVLKNGGRYMVLYP